MVVVIDANVLVSAAIIKNSIPDKAVRAALSLNLLYVLQVLIISYLRSFNLRP
jgi:predicted nucleic acid-binding protein